MGYEINYNPQHYVDAAAACRMIRAEAWEVQCAMQAAGMRVLLCSTEAYLIGRRAGLAPVLPRLQALEGCLQEVRVLAAQACAEAEDLAGKLETAIENATEAERRIRAMISLLSAPRTILDGWSAAGQNDRRPPRQDTERLLELLAVLLTADALPLRKTDPQGNPVDEVLQQVSQLLDEQNLLRRQPIGIESFESLGKMNLDGGLGSYYRLQDEVRKKEAQILIGRAERGHRDVYLVILPGTHGELDDDNPFNPRGIIDSLGYDSQNYAQAIEESLEVSGARPGDEVIFSGHSQGGIHAMNLASNPMLRRKFEVTSVLTLGSPVGNIELPDEVKSLHLEDATDPVPGMDGRSNRRKDHQVTLTFPGPANPEALDSGGFGRGHHVENYGEHLEEVEQHPAAELGPTLEGLRFSPGPILLHSFRLRREERPRRRESGKDREKTRQLGTIAPPH